MTPAPLASLPMYDRPELAAAHDALWSAIRDALAGEGIAAPAALDRDVGLWEGWTDPGLVLGQTCSLPLRTRLAGRVTVIGTFDYGLPGAAPGNYYSTFVGRAGEWDAPATPAAVATLRLAVNGPESQSGWAAPWFWARSAGISLSPAMTSGGHRASAAAVAEGAADWASLDAVTWRGIVRWEPELARQLTVIGQSAASPALPLIAAKGADRAAYLRAIPAALDAAGAGIRAALGITGFVPLMESDYLALPNPPAG